MRDLGNAGLRPSIKRDFRAGLCDPGIPRPCRVSTIIPGIRQAYGVLRVRPSVRVPSGSFIFKYRRQRLKIHSRTRAHAFVHARLNGLLTKTPRALSPFCISLLAIGTAPRVHILVEISAAR